MKAANVSSRVTEARRRLEALIRETDGDRLPSEDALATQLGVSRPTVRAALGELEAAGYIQRRHGRGTFINPVAARIEARLELWEEFSALVARAGFAPSVRVLGTERRAMPADIARALGHEPGAEAWAVRRVFLADGQPAIHCEDFVPCALLPDDFDPAELSRDDTFHVLAAHRHPPIDYAFSRVSAQLAQARLARDLDLAEGTPLLSFTSTAYRADNRPVFACVEHYRPGIVDFSLLRRHV
ncbi:GntR family transcriptional regulator [Solimonas variicoloris]|uniref:GntR family transcriptional regulator n=1 Tax=Solimonas variicoloris TaxID=254408 RepID=UPI00036E5EAA|nr:GntR family transcriptional regulator [Solimonas variicoloris]